MTPAKIALGDKLFHDDRFSTTGEISCSTCHELERGFTGSPLSTSEGILGLIGTRNSPTTTNAAYFKTLAALPRRTIRSTIFCPAAFGPWT